VIRKDSRTDNFNKPGTDLSSNQVVEVGDIVANKMKTWQGSIAVSTEYGIVSPAYMVFERDDSIHPRFLHYLLRSQPYIAQYGRLSYGVRIGQWDLRWEDLKDVRVLVPAPSYQGLVADFLDRETDRIDALVDAKRRLIDLLAEKRTALITHAVTKGLDPTVPMKDSGIPWIGEIPAHWDVVPLKYHADVQTGVTLGRRFDPQVQLVRRPYLRVANVQAGFTDLDEIADIDVPVSEVGRYELRAGDVLMTEGGDIDKLGRGVVWEGQIDGCLHQNHIFAVRPDRWLNPHFLSLLLGIGHGRTYFELTAKKTTNLASTNTTNLKAFPIVLPDRSEQEVLVNLLSLRSEQFERAASALTQQFKLLTEYRQAVGTAAVTGQLDEATLKGRKPADEVLGVEVPS
jgi:type I restriction enzyme S subunit